ncbi:MAG: tetratricopeptide repeat protein [Deltaproteobacteria bacterium]|nr:tetratricopeptide repeat protein [Deltaproteobacteria bacterium]
MTDDSKKASRSSKAPKTKLAIALDAVRSHPDLQENWDEVEELADTLQRPTDVKELYRSVLETDLSTSLASEIGQRAVRFQEDWYGEDSADLPELLLRILEIDPNAEWAFQRLTVAYTVSERWDELLALYDRSINLTNETGRQMQLLDEAAHVAKDFAQQPDRAIDYLTRLLSLDLANTTLAASLERLLERQNRYSDLVQMWRSRLGVLPAKEVKKARQRIAATAFEKTGDASTALAEVKMILKDSPGDSDAYSLLEKILQADFASAQDRREALALLKKRFGEIDRPEEVVRVLESSLSFVRQEERKATLRELTERLVNLGQAPRAIEYQAALLVLEPTPEVQELLLALAEQTHLYERYANAFVEAAEACEDARRSIELLMEAAKARQEQIGDEATAIELYQRVFTSEADPDKKLAAGRRLNQLLAKTDRRQHRLSVLTVLPSLESEESERKRVLGQLAQLAAEMGDQALAIQAWNSRIEMDAVDVEALSALIEIRHQNSEWQQLLELLRQRLESAISEKQKRADLVRIATIYSEKLNERDAAIEVWREIQQRFGESGETVSALTTLLSASERWAELAQIIEAAAERETARFTELQVRLGDAYRERLNQLLEAAECYRKTLQTDPKNQAARRGLVALLDNDVSRKAAVGALIDTFEKTEEWKNTLSILEHRLAVTESPERQAQILIEAAQLFEERERDAKSALSCLRRAFALRPDDRDTEDDLRRLAESLDSWRTLDEAYEETLANLGDAPLRAAELHFERATVLEERLSDRAAALKAYSEAARLAPERLDFVTAAVRAAARQNAWDDAARHMVVCMKTRGQIENALFELVESIASESAGWDGLCEALTVAINNGEGLSPELLHTFELRLALWHKNQRNDPDAAQASLLRADEYKGGVIEVYQLLTELQRQDPSAALIDTLLKLADLDDRNLDPLYEAAKIAKEKAADREVEIAILDRLYRSAVKLWKLGVAPAGKVQLETCVSWTMDRLVKRYSEHNEHKKAVELLAETASLPFDSDSSQAMRRQAASIASSALGETARAIELYRDIIEIDPKDLNAIRQLGILYERENLLSDLFLLRQHELKLDVDQERRLELRLDLARIFNVLEERGGSLQSLKANLEDYPGHPQTLEALSRTLIGKGQHGLLVTILAQQAKILSNSGARGQAANLWWRAAEMSESDLNDPDKAVEFYGKHSALEPDGEATAHLARIYSDRKEYDKAAEWLEQRLQRFSAPERNAVAVQLAKVYLSADNPDGARRTLEHALSVDPTAQDIRDALAERYREEQSYAQLAALLSDGTRYLTDSDKQLAYINEASDIYFNRLRTKEKAAAILKLAVELRPEQRELRMMLADSLHDARQFGEAKKVLQGLIDDFGRKRSTERAALHFKLAHVARDAGEIEQAMEQLETATKMDLSHVEALRMMAELARQRGELERSERAYRGLLMLLKQQQPGRDDTLGSSVVFCELAGIARERGHVEQAEELLESAFELAMQSDAEANRLQVALRKHNQVDLLLRLFDTRLKNVQKPQVEAEILSAKADVLEEPLGKDEEALQARIRALNLDPSSDALHRSTSALAARMGEMKRYIDCVTALAESATIKPGKRNRILAAKLMMRLGEAVEKEMGDLDRAVSWYAKVEASGEYVAQAWLALARVAGARGDLAERRRVLQHISRLGDDEASPEARIDAMFQLAELELADDESREQGIATLSNAMQLDRDPDNRRSRKILESIVRIESGDKKLLSLYQKVARASGDQHMLLDYLERRAQLEDATLEEIKEGVELALFLHLPERAEPLLNLALQRSRSAGKRAKKSTWVLSSLANCRKQAGDMAGAMAFLKQAAEVNDEEQEALTKQLAQMAAGPGGDLEIAAEAYQRLLKNNPSDRDLWEPLLQVYKTAADRKRYDDLVNQTLDCLIEPGLRCELRMEHAHFIIDVLKDEREAIPVLHNLLSEEPDHTEATLLLSDIYQRSGMNAEYADLLSRQYDRARDREDKQAVAELGLRIGSLLESTRPAEAIDVYRSALEWVPESRELLESLLSLLGPEADLSDRAEVMQQILKTESGNRAASLALELEGVWRSLNNDEMLQQALELGYRACPQDESLREMLERFYVERERWAELAQLMLQEAARSDSPTAAVARLKNAATIYREQVGDINASADALRKALYVLPEDLSLLAELSRNLAAAGEHRTAIEDVTRLLDGHPQMDAVRVDLLRVRAELYTAIEEHKKAVVDLEEAFSLESAGVAANLIEALTALKQQALARSDRNTARAANLRLVQILRETGDQEQARENLVSWVERDTGDREALRLLRAIDTENKRWEDVITVCDRLIEIERGDDLAEVAVALAEACHQIDRPELGRVGLEKVLKALPDNEQIRSYLRIIYQQTGAQAELAKILQHEAAGVEDPQAKLKLLLKIGELLLSANDAASALIPLGEALELEPAHDAAIALLVDAYTQLGRLDEASDMLNKAIEMHRRRRSPELAILQQRMARLAALTGGLELQVDWLTQAIETDRKNPEIAAELAEAAIAMGNYDLAMKSLRAITMMNDPKPMSRAMAFFKQALIAYHQNDLRRAQHWARKAKSLDPDMSEVDGFLRKIEGGG